MAAGFYNGEIMFADNVRFDGDTQPGQVTADGQLLIGSSVAPNIRVATLSSSDGSVTITNGAGTIDLQASTGTITDVTATNAGASVTFTGTTVKDLEVTDAYGNTSIGKDAGNVANLGGENVVIGEGAGQNLAGNGLNAFGSENVLIGFGAGNLMTDSFSNIAVGTQTLNKATTAFVNTCVGYACGQGLLTGQQNILIGVNSGNNYSSSESGNIIIGGGPGTVTESNTIRIGSQGSSPGQQNRAFIAGVNNNLLPFGFLSVAVDSTTGQLGYTYFTDGSANTFLGYLSGNGTLSGSSNLGVGQTSLSGITTGSQNTAYGSGSLSSLLTGDNNTVIGFQAGSVYDGAQSNNILIANPGNLLDADTIRVGETQTSAYIAGVAGVTTSNGEVVTIDTTTGQLGSRPDAFITVSGTLTSTQIKSLRASPVLIIPAQGVGNYIRLISITSKFNYAGTNQFTGSNNVILYPGGVFTNPVATLLTTTILNGTTTQCFLPLATASSGLSTIYDNTGVEISISSVTEVGGNAADDNTLSYSITYQVVSI